MKLQLVKKVIEFDKHRVGGSIPPRRTIINIKAQVILGFLFFQYLSYIIIDSNERGFY